MAATGSKKKQTARKPGRPRKNSRQQFEVQESFIRAEVLILLSFAVAVLLFLSNFNLCGILGEALRRIQLGIFGTLGFLIPILLFLGTCFLLSNRGNQVAALKMVASVIALLSLCGLMQLIFGKPWGTGQKLTQVYQDSASSGLGGGWLGGFIAGGLRNVVGIVGAYIILLISLLISGVCITERSFVKVVKRGRDLAYQHTKENVERRRESYAEAAAEKRRLREEKKVRGVNFDSTKLEEESAFDRMLKEEEDLLQREVIEAEHSIGSREQGNVLEREVALTEPEPSAADMFTGSIAMPPGYDDNYNNADTVPFEADEPSYLTGGAFPASGLRVPKLNKSPDSSDTEFNPQDEKAEFDRGTYMKESKQQGINYNSFYIPEEPKQVVTAGGKVIDTDTEALQKKLETKKKQLREDGVTSTAVSMEIKEKESIPKKKYKFPPTSLLKRSSKGAGNFSDKEYKATAIKLQRTLRDFGVGVTVTNISCGPSVTRYELIPEQGVKVSKIVGLTDDIKLSLAAEDIRIEAPIPGKSAVGIEVPNKENNIVYLRELLESDAFQRSQSRLAFAVGKDIGGQVVVTDIGKMPHLLIAGATGSGKSVCINTLIMSIIFKSKPEDVRLIMIDPKVVELSVYNGIPHLLIPVVTDPKKASGALNWAVAEMTDRYKKFAEYNVRDVRGYNDKIETVNKAVSPELRGAAERLPQIVIIVDELADLMMVAPGEVEDAVCRLAQLARAAGIHLVIATQRPSVNVITGLIKANVPSRIAFSVSSGVDSRTIIDMNGAEKLLGKGDMLFYPAGYPKPQRVQGAFVSDQEVQKVVNFLTEQGLAAQYSAEIETKVNAAPESGLQGGGGNRDEYFAQAGRFIIEKEKASIGMLQRAFKIGFNRAARVMDQLCEAGVVGEEEGTKPRKVLITMEEFEEILMASD